MGMKLLEGVYDKNILKAVFILGGPGSSKSFIATQVMAPFGMKSVDSDKEFEYLLRRSGKVSGDKIDLNLIGDYTDIRNRATDLSTGFENAWISGRLGLVIQSTGYDIKKVAKHREMLESIGYDTYCVFVNTSLPVAIERNKNRPRTVPDDVVTTKWTQFNSNLGRLQHIFGAGRFLIFDNSNPYPSSIRRLFRNVRAMIATPLANRIGKQWINDQLKLKNRYTNTNP